MDYCVAGAAFISSVLSYVSTLPHFIQKSADFGSETSFATEAENHTTRRFLRGLLNQGNTCLVVGAYLCLATLP